MTENIGAIEATKSRDPTIASNTREIIMHPTKKAISSVRTHKNIKVIVKHMIGTLMIEKVNLLDQMRVKKT